MWVETPPDINTEDMLLVAVDNKVAYIYGSAFYVNDKGQNKIRLCYSQPPVDSITEGVKMLGEAQKEQLS